MRELQVLCSGGEVGSLKDSRDKQAQRGCSCCTAVPSKNISSHLPDLIQHHKTLFSFAAFLVQPFPNAGGHFPALAAQLVRVSPSTAPIADPNCHRGLSCSSRATEIPWLQNPHQEPPEQGGAAEDAGDGRAKGKKHG